MEASKIVFRHSIDEGGKGGVTTCYLKNEDGQVVSLGMAICSERDYYNKKRGRVISEGRARKVLLNGKTISTRVGKDDYLSFATGGEPCQP